MEPFKLPSVEEFKEQKERGQYFNWQHSYGRAAQVISAQLAEIVSKLDGVLQALKAKDE